MGFESEPSGVVMGVVPHPFQSVEEVEDFPWNVSLSGSYTQAELQNIRTWYANSRIHQGGGSFGPLTVTACILGIEECVRMTHTHPDVLLAVLRHVTDFLLLLAQKEEKEGAQAFTLACTDRFVSSALTDAARDVALKRIAVNKKYPATK